MRALTVQQPWAWAIVHGGKDVENRTQQWTYRGPLAIHAGTRISDRGMDSPLIGAALRRLGHIGSGPRFPGDPDLGAPLHQGAIIGVVDLVDVHTSISCVDEHGAMCSAWAESSYVEHSDRVRRDVVHLTLERPRPITPIRCGGALGLWSPPAEVLAQIADQLT